MVRTKAKAKSLPLPTAVKTSPPRETRAESVHRSLETALAAHFGRPRRIIRLDRCASPYSTSFALEDLDIELDGGEALELVWKDLSWRSLRPQARKIRPRIVYDPRREMWVYESVLSKLNLGTPTFFGRVTDESRGRYWLFIERVAAAKLCHTGEFAAWKRAARWLAKFHSVVDPRKLSGVETPLLRYDGSFYATWLRRAMAFLFNRSDVSPTELDRFARLADRYQPVISRLMALEPAFIHGEFYASNILVQRRNRSWRICPIDWEMAAIGPRLMDLAALTSGNWTDDQRKKMVNAYRDGWSERGAGPATSKLSESLDYCRLHLAVQWLGWAKDWSPPADQARNWLSEALAISDRLGL